MEKIGIIGFGHMGQSIAHALVTRLGRQVMASDQKSPQNHPYLKNHRNCCGEKISLIMSNYELLRRVGMIILAVRPFQMAEVLAEIKNETSKLKSGKSFILISIAAGIPLSFLKKKSGCRKIVRVMPNLPAQIGQGMSVWKSIGLKAQEKNLVKKILQSFGEEIEVKNENFINAATAVSGSGPGYVFAFLAGLQKAAEKLGFSKEQAKILALQTVLGSTAYAKNSEENFDALASQVATKGGTTEAAFKILKKIAWGKNLVKAVHAAYLKAKKFSSFTR